MLDEINRRFGRHVAGIVNECTDTDQVPKPPWRERKQAHIDHMKLASNGALFVVAADKLHNVNSMVDDFIAIGEKLWQRFNAPSRPQDILWYYSEMHVALGDRLGNIRIVERLGEGIDRLNLLANQK